LAELSRFVTVSWIFAPRRSSYAVGSIDLAAKRVSEKTAGCDSNFLVRSTIFSGASDAVAEGE